MPEQTPAYDLFVLIDPEVPDERRTGIVEEIRKRISGGDGSLKGDVEWGTRRLAYEINHRSDAYYHLFQFEASAGLLETLNRSLAIEDGVLRHRIMRLPKGAPDEPPKPPSAARETEPTREGRHGRRHASAPSAEESAAPPEERRSAPPAPGPDESAPPAAEGAATTSAPTADEAETPESSGTEA